MSHWHSQARQLQDHVPKPNNEAHSGQADNGQERLDASLMGVT